jgi:hypothetical protein
MDKYRYRLRSTGHSSDRYGNCEVCGNRCSDVFIQVEEVQYEIPQEGDKPVEISWTHYGCQTIFGHEDCLKSKQRK